MEKLTQKSLEAAYHQGEKFKEKIFNLAAAITKNPHQNMKTILPEEVSALQKELDTIVFKVFRNDAIEDSFLRTVRQSNEVLRDLRLLALAQKELRGKWWGDWIHYASQRFLKIAVAQERSGVNRGVYFPFLIIILILLPKPLVYYIIM